MEAVIPYGKQSINQDDINAVIEVLRSDFLTQGPRVLEFEKSFSRYVGAKYSVAVSNGTAALHLAMMALNVKEGHKVITTPITFVASANCVLYCGGDIEFVDIDPESYCIDLNKLEDKLKLSPGNYQGVIPVDLAGYPINMNDLHTLSQKYGFWIVEDACHAPGATYHDTKGTLQFSGNCNYTDMAVFSFHPVKHIACGEGGMITTNNFDHYQKLLSLRTHGITREPTQLTKNDGGWYYEMQSLGYNYRIPDMLCALGNSQLKRADESLALRHKIIERYNDELGSLPIKLPFVPKDAKHAYHLYIIQTQKRRELYDYLKANNIHTQVHYIPIHQQPYYVQKYGKQHFPISESYYENCLSLPVYQSLTFDEQSKVINKIKSFFERG